MLRSIDRVATALASILLFLTVLLTLGDVIGRNLLSQPIPGATELTELALVGITFLIYPRLALQRQHIVIDLFDRVMGTLARRMQQALGGVLGAILFGVIGWRLLTLAERAHGYGDVTGYLKLPIYPAFYFMAGMSLLTAACFAVTGILAVTAPSRAFHDQDQAAGLE